MKKQFTLGAAALLLGFGIAGCSNTAEGAKEDTTNAADATKKAADNAGQAVSSAATNAADATKKAADNAGQAVSSAATNAADATKDAAKNTSAALSLTPKVKTAITADKELNDTANMINVDSADNVVHLKGHVVTNEMKKKAGDIAMKTLKDANATDKVSNELTVEKH